MKRFVLLARWLAPCLASSLALSLLSCGKAAQPLAPGSTGAFGIVTVDGKQKLYLPQATPSILVVDAGLAGSGSSGAPAQLKIIPLGGQEVADSTGGDATIVLAASTHSHTLWFIDPHLDTVVKTATLPYDDQSSFSGGGGYVTGIVVDTAHRRAVLSTGRGFAIVDLDARAILRTIPAAPAENFGYDSGQQRILAPFYDCPQALDVCATYKTLAGATMTDGLNLIDLRDDAVYTFQDPAAANPAQPLGGEPDSAAVDPAGGVALIPSEASGGTTVLDLNAAKLDRATKSFTAPRLAIATSPALTGVSAEPTHHLAFWEEESGSTVAVADLGTERAGKISSLTSGILPSPPGTQEAWSNLGDPHGLAVSTGLHSGRPVGFVVNSTRTWIARIDLLAMLAARQGDKVLGPGEMSAFVTFLDPQGPVR